jgi:hypothetical protein
MNAETVARAPGGCGAGVGWVARFEPAKTMLGSCPGGAVRLADPSDVLMVGEGIETCLAVMQATVRQAGSLTLNGNRIRSRQTQRRRPADRQLK